MQKRLVRDWMSGPVVTVHERALLPEARSLLADHTIRRLPVVDDSGHLVGIVTQSDVFKISASHATDVQDYDLYSTAGHLPVRRFMISPVVSVGPDEDVVAAARLMLAHNISGLPVVEGAMIVGIITESNIFRVLLAEEA